MSVPFLLGSSVPFSVTSGEEPEPLWSGLVYKG